MDENNAITLIQETFNYPFTENNYLKFSKNLIDDLTFNLNPIWKNNRELPTNIKSKINRFKNIGTYEYKNGERIGIVSVELDSESTVNKSRFLQRDFSKWFIEKNDLDAILVSFFASEYEDWRFSLIKQDLKREITDKGKIKVSREITPLRRYSYLVGKNEPNHTAKAQLSPLLLDDNKNPSLDDLIEAFSVENVTKNFYKDYTSVFYNFEKYISENYDLSETEVRSFTQTLFNRLMFARFIEKKNWLQFNNSNKYLYELFAAGNYKEQSFYNGRLKYLFFEGFSDEKINENEAYGKVNFFGGELFDKTLIDDKVKDIPNDLFNEILSSEGLFYKYNFTVEESTPLETQVSIDPEMLGKVFEELVTGRNESGAFYTPKNIVEYMVKSSLAEHLNNKELVLLGKFENKDKNKYLENLKSLKILDPACGSGAYLLGMMNELVNLYKLLKNLNEEDDDIYRIKLEIIQNNLYGVDIDSVAIEIAKLRLWLTLVVEYKGAKPEPLPNLNFKIENGNSLMSSIEQNKEPDLFLEGIIRQFDVLKSEYQRAIRKNKKDRLTKEIAKLKDEIKNSLFGSHHNQNFFEWRLEFAEVFINKNNPGFDIVISNPPYIRHEDITDQKEYLKKNFDVYTSKADLYTYFYEKCLKLTAKNKISILITSNKWLLNKYGSELREFIKNNYSIISLIDFKHIKVFSSATVDTCITILKNEKPHNNSFYYSENLTEDKLVLLQKDLDVDRFSFLNKKDINLKKFLDSRFKNVVSEFNIKFNSGIKTGYNKAFIINDIEKNNLNQNDTDNNIFKKILKGKEITKWKTKWKNNWLINSHNGNKNFGPRVNVREDYPKIFEHLKKHEKSLKKRWDKGDDWTNLRDCSYLNEFSNPKIIWNDISDYTNFSYDDSGCYLLNTVYFISGKKEDLKYLLGIFNSRFFDTIYKNFYCGGSLGNKGYRFIKEYLVKVPIPNYDKKNKLKIIEKVDKIITNNLNLNQIEKLENEINEIVEKLYLKLFNIET